MAIHDYPTSESGMKLVNEHEEAQFEKQGSHGPEAEEPQFPPPPAKQAPMSGGPVPQAKSTTKQSDVIGGGGG